MDKITVRLFSNCWKVSFGKAHYPQASAGSGSKEKPRGKTVYPSVYDAGGNWTDGDFCSSFIWL